jgi:hypothetical protein
MQQETKRLHSGEAATAGEGGVIRTVIKSLRGGHGGRQRVFAASSLGGAAREQYAAMEAGGGAVAAPPKKGSSKTGSKTGQPQAVVAENLSGPSGNDFLFFLFWYFWLTIQNTANRHVSNAFDLLGVFISFPLARCAPHFTPPPFWGREVPKKKTVYVGEVMFASAWARSWLYLRF